jgi:endonuclease/exonuclease/phosphatase family metal-dependent hydrolase
MLRLMTLNINYRVGKHGSWDDRRPLIAQAIHRAQADVVALQAVERVGNVGQASELAALLNYEHMEFVGATKTTSGATRGSAFIARRQLGAIAVQQLSHRGDHEDSDRRVVLRTRIGTRGGAVDLYNAHFSWVSPQALDNARETLAFAETNPALLLGDLNSGPDSQALQALTHAGWIDVWGALRPNDGGYTFEADQPRLRIDYVLANASVRERVRSIERVGVDSAGAPRLSDHLGLVVALSDA